MDTKARAMKARAGMQAMPWDALPAAQEKVREALPLLTHPDEAVALQALRIVTEAWLAWHDWADSVIDEEAS